VLDITLHLAASIRLALATASCWARRVYSAITGRFGFIGLSAQAMNLTRTCRKCGLQPGFHALRGSDWLRPDPLEGRTCREAMRLSPAHTGHEC